MLKFNTTNSEEPPATKECSLREDIIMTNSIYLTNENNLEELQILDAKRFDDGLYYFVAKNTDGINKVMVIGNSFVSY